MKVFRPSVNRFCSGAAAAAPVTSVTSRWITVWGVFGLVMSREEREGLNAIIPSGGLVCQATNSRMKTGERKRASGMG